MVEKVVYNNIQDGITLIELLKQKFGVKDGDVSDDNLSLIANDNLSEITSRYQSEEQNNIPKEYIKFGTKLVIREDIFNDLRKVFVKRVRVAPFTDISAFWSDQIKEIHEDDKYAPRFSAEFVQDFQYDKRYEFVTVYAYSKVMKRFINLTDFVQSVQVNNTDAGLSFGIQLPAITGTRRDTRETSFDFFGYEQALNFDVLERWNFIKENFEVYKSQEFRNYYHKGSMYREDGKFKRFNDFIFHMVLSQSDMIWVKFEKLQLEDNVGEDEFIEVTESDVNKHYWDCIGYIDSNSIVHSTETNNVSISIQGRSQNKLFLDDGVYYFPYTINEDGDDEESAKSVVFANTEEASKSTSFSRLVRIVGIWQENKFFQGTSVASLVDTIVSQAATVKVLPDEVFNRLDGAIPKGEGYFGAWRLFKLLTDTDANNRILVNSSFATMKGTLWSFLSGLCLFPYLEIIQDTYGTQNFMIVRKPPLTRTSWVKNTTIDIPTGNIVQMDVEFETERIYSWFRLLPQAFFAGDAKMSEFYFPAIFLPEYAEIWGSRPLELTSNYLDYGYDINELKDGYEQAKNDLQTLITVNAYMPFIRSGTIVIMGDRTIKKGMNVRIEATGEVYHVTGVMNSYVNDGSNVGRQTILQIDRGMVEDDYDRYFNLVNFGEFGTDAQSNAFRWSVNVNKENFNYLLERRQFGKSL